MTFKTPAVLRCNERKGRCLQRALPAGAKPSTRVLLKRCNAALLNRLQHPCPPHLHLHLPVLTDSEPGHWLQPPSHIINIITMSNSSSAACKREPASPASTFPPRRSLRRAVVQQRPRGQDRATSQHQKAPLSQWDQFLLPVLTKANQPRASQLQGYLQDTTSRHKLLTVLILRKYNSDLNSSSYFSPVVIDLFFF